MPVDHVHRSSGVLSIDKQQSAFGVDSVKQHQTQRSARRPVNVPNEVSSWVIQRSSWSISPITASV